ncbi:MAG: plasmid stabilization protein [Bdellovibrionales bacterium RBG_16_40_8]|nr:MAG: plasmid stabilization protein [Bdellovibrionales bacterium RBG_16_40_8]
MRNLIWGATFLRAYKRTIKKRPAQKKDIEKALRLLADDPFTPQLETHKLKGKLAGTWACRISYDLRIIFDFIKNDKQKDDDILLIELGTHDEVY